jgi:ADP-heptose:LPS heptosyltransferase
VKILINRTDAIGDTILTTPIAARLREEYPDADIRFIISPISAPLFENHPVVNGTFIYNKKDALFRKISCLSKVFKEFHPDLYIFTGGDHFISFYSWLKRVNIRGGLVSKWQSFAFLNKGVRQKRSLVTMHESDYNLNLLSALGINYDSKRRDNFRPQITVDTSSRVKDLVEFKEELNSNGLDSSKENIFIHPGMTGHTLNWSSRNYGRLIDKMERRFPDRFNWIISHTPSDQAYLVGIKDHIAKCDHLKNSVFFFDGSIKGLSHYMRILSLAKAFIGPSTGTVHIANTLGVKTVGIYSPIKVQSSMRWGPFNRDSENTRLVIPDVVCGEQFKCAGASCPYYECMSKIEVQDIINELINLLNLEK